MIRVIRPAGVPFLATAAMTTVTSSPALNVLAVKPKLTSVDGALFSQIQCTTLPFSSVTSTIRHASALVHSHCVIFPLMVTVLFSYEAFPWWANTGVEPARRTNSSKLSCNSLFINTLQILNSKGRGRGGKSICSPQRAINAAPPFARHNKTACYLSHLGIHDVTIGEDDPADTHDRRAVLGHGCHHHRYFVAGLEGLGGETKIDESRGSLVLADPVHDLAVLIGDVEHQERMRIRPQPLCDFSFDGDLLVLVRRISVMREQRG